MGINENRQSSGGYRDPESFDRVAASSIAEMAYNISLQREQHIINGVFTHLRNAGIASITELKEEFGPREGRSFLGGVGIAVMETATILDRYNMMLADSVAFPHLYRFLRSLELDRMHKRGGNTLFIGSGITVPEYLANYMVPPTVEEIDELYKSGKKDFIDQGAARLAQAGKAGKLPEFHAPLLEGMAIAVEPSIKYLSHIPTLSKRYGVPPSAIHVRPYTIGAIMDEDDTPGGLTSVIWHRAEPDLALRPGSQDLDAGLLEDIVDFSFDKLEPGGSLIMTVGPGNRDLDESEYTQRMDMMHKVVSILRKKNGAQMWNGPVNMHNNETTKLLFGEPTAGLIAAAVAQKAA